MKSQLNKSELDFITRKLNPFKKSTEDFFEIDDLFKKIRKVNYINARRFFIRYVDNFLLNEFTQKKLFSTAMLGAYMNCDHVTIVHSNKKFNDLITYDKQYRLLWEKYKKYTHKTSEVFTQSRHFKRILIDFILALDHREDRMILERLTEDFPSLKNLKSEHQLQTFYNE